MQRSLHDATAAQTQSVSLAIGEDVWRLYVYGVTRVGPELFIQTALFGPRTCTAVVRVPARRTRRETAREVVALIREWLSSGDQGDHAFLEPDGAAMSAC